MADTAHGGNNRPLKNSSTWETAEVEDWMFGWDQVPHGQRPLQDMLAERFHIETRKQLQTLQTPLDHAWAARDGLNSRAALAKLVQEFTRSSVALCAIWFFGLIATIYASSRLSETELWCFSLTFVIIALWRFLLVAGLISEGQWQIDRKSDSRMWRKVRSGILALAFSHRYLLWMGPVFLLSLGLIIGSAQIEYGEDGFWSYLRPADLAPGAASFHSSLKATVWALPVIGAGLLRQAYVTLSQWLVERGQMQARLRMLDLLEDNWEAGTAFSGALEHQDNKFLSDQIELLRKRFTAKQDQALRVFGTQSATNASLVAIMSLLAPLNAMSPDTGIDFKQEARFLAQLAAEERELWPEDSTKLASLQDTAAFDLGQTSRVLAPMPCADLNRAEFVRRADEKRSFVHNTLIAASLMDCLEKSNRAQAAATLQVRDEMIEWHSALGNLAQLIAERPFPQPQSSRKTYLCILPFMRNCVQDSQVDVSTEGLGQVAFDPAEFIGKVGEAEAALKRLEGRYRVELVADASEFDTTLEKVEQSLAAFSQTRRVTLSAEIEDAHRNIGALMAALDKVPTDRGVIVNAQVDSALASLEMVLEKLAMIGLGAEADIHVKNSDAIEKIETVLEKLKALRTADHVTITANAEDVFMELALARRALENLLKLQKEHVFTHPSQSPVNFNFWIGSPEQETIPGLGNCEFLGARLFATDAPLRVEVVNAWDEKSWIFPAGHGPVNEPQAYLEQTLASLQPNKRLYVLGTADLEGRSDYNFLLSQERANFVSEAITSSGTQIAPVALSIGEAGWLTGLGLPQAEKDASHRAASIFACGRAETKF